MYIAIELENHIRKKLKQTLQHLQFPDTIRLETPSSPDFGDLAFPCFSLCSVSKKSPYETAKYILSHLEKPDGVNKMEVHNGYINFWFDTNQILANTLTSIFKKGKEYGILPTKDQKVIVEHTSANPNGPLHVGRARNPIIGDTITRLMKADGFHVESQFYLDDLGKQVAILTWAFHHLDETDLSKKTMDKPDHHAVRFYQKAHELMQRDEKIATEIDELVHKSELGDEDAIDMGKKSYEPVLTGISESLSRINISIDNFIPESRFVKNGSVLKVIEHLKQTPYCNEEEGAFYLDLEEFGVKGRSTKFFITRSNGTSLYATRDVAYHLWKNSQADRLVNILGEDHKLESQQVNIALELLNADKKPIPVFYSFVSLPGGKMSTRRGRVVYLDDLIEESKQRAFVEVEKRRGKELSTEKMKDIAEVVGVGALRYNIIKVQPEKHIEFKWEEALSFEGNTAPFIQYATARCASILRKSKIESKVIKDSCNSQVLTHESEGRLGKQLAKLPIIIDEAAQGFKPHLITQYLFDTASLFNQFYRDCSVLSADNEMVKYSRLGLVLSTKIVLENGLALLGVDGLDEM
ncbi:MAG TPA: arginine--tRNA ligase [Candidatus Thermoplasmatota archaeon]|nr:arginine--tRNA ligase [Candidatus Thermoplasmatota archaeon]